MIAVLCMTFQCPFPQNPHSVRNRGQFANVCYSEKRQLERPKAIGLISSQSAISGRQTRIDNACLSMVPVSHCHNCDIRVPVNQ
jgi:hypothetical protein